MMRQQAGGIQSVSKLIEWFDPAVRCRYVAPDSIWEMLEEKLIFLTNNGRSFVLEYGSGVYYGLRRVALEQGGFDVYAKLFETCVEFMERCGYIWNSVPLEDARDLILKTSENDYWNVITWLINSQFDNLCGCLSSLVRTEHAHYHSETRQLAINVYERSRANEIDEDYMGLVELALLGCITYLRTVLTQANLEKLAGILYYWWKRTSQKNYNGQLYMLVYQNLKIDGESHLSTVQKHFEHRNRSLYRDYEKYGEVCISYADQVPPL